MRKYFFCLFCFFILHGFSLADSSHNKKSSKIIGGNFITPNEAPFAVAIVNSKDPNNYSSAFCGATIISSRWALTAAHCVCDENGNIDKKADDIKILAGTTNLLSGDGKRIGVRDIIPHPFYNARNHDCDIAMIELKEPSNVTPISLCSSNTPKDGSLAAAIGFGRTSNSSMAMSPVQKFANMPIVSDANCKGVYGATAITSSMVCAGWYEGGDNTCHGDSGGPLITMENGEAKLYGVVSWSSELGCALAGKPTVFTKVTDPNISFFLNVLRNKQVPNEPCFMMPKSLSHNFSSIPTTSDIVTFTVESASDCIAPSAYHYFSYCPNYGSNSYDPNFWTPFSNGFINSNSQAIKFPRAGNYVVVAWVNSAPVAPEPIQLIGTTITIAP